MTGLSSAEENLWELYPIPNLCHVVFVFCFVLSTMYYYRRKSLFPLKGRGSRTVFAICGFYLASAVSAAARGPSWPCVCDLVVSAVSSYCAIAIYAYRVLVLLARHDMANQLQLTLTSSLRKRVGYGGRCLSFFKRSTGALIAFAMTVAAFSFSLAVLLGDNYKCRGIGGFVMNGLLAILTLPVLLYLGIKLRRYPADGRNIYIEFRMMALCSLGVLIVMIFVVLFTYMPFTNLIFLDLLGGGFMCTALLYPVYLSYGHQRLSHKRTSSGQMAGKPVNIDELLLSSDFLEAFLAHLKQEFNAESLVFWKSVKTFKELGERPIQDMTRDAREIFETYVAEGAPYQLNTSLSSVQETQTQLQRAEAEGSGFLEVFDTLFSEVLTLIKNDPLPRFLRTPAGKPFKLNLEGSTTSKTAFDSPSPSSKRSSITSSSHHSSSSVSSFL